MTEEVGTEHARRAVLAHRDPADVRAGVASFAGCRRPPFTPFVPPPD